MDPWRYSTEGISVALRVTPRGGRDDIDGVETLANGRSVVKVRVRAIAEGGEANRAVTELLARALGVPKRSVRVLSGTTSRLKQIAVDGDPSETWRHVAETDRGEAGLIHREGLRWRPGSSMEKSLHRSFAAVSPTRWRGCSVRTG